jgi:hypothetical protein
MVGNKHWNEEEKQALKQFYKAVPNGKLRELLATRSEIAIRNQAHQMGLHKSPQRISEMGRDNVEKRWAPLRPPPEIQA